LSSRAGPPHTSCSVRTLYYVAKRATFIFVGEPVPDVNISNSIGDADVLSESGHRRLWRRRRRGRKRHPERNCISGRNTDAGGHRYTDGEADRFTDRDANCYAKAQRLTDGYGNGHGNGHGHRKCDTGKDGIAVTDADSDSGRDRNAGSYCHAGEDGNADSGTNGNADGNADGNTNSSADGNTDSGTNGNTDRDTNGNADADTDGHTHGVTDAHRNAIADAGTSGSRPAQRSSVARHLVHRTRQPANYRDGVRDELPRHVQRNGGSTDLPAHREHLADERLNGSLHGHSNWCRRL
jgi:hypothetical protein